MNPTIPKESVPIAKSCYRPRTRHVLARSLLIFLATLPVLLLSAPAQEVSVVFEGMPLKKVESSFQATQMSDLNAEKSFEYQVRIVQRGGRYYWASREMKELIRSEGPAYVAYFAKGGAGYVRTLTPAMLDMRDRLP